MQQMNAEQAMTIAKSAVTLDRMRQQLWAQEARTQRTLQGQALRLSVQRAQADLDDAIAQVVGR